MPGLFRSLNKISNFGNMLYPRMTLSSVELKSAIITETERFPRAFLTLNTLQIISPLNYRNKRLTHFTKLDKTLSSTSCARLRPRFVPMRVKSFRIVANYSEFNETKLRKNYSDGANYVQDSAPGLLPFHGGNTSSMRTSPTKRVNKSPFFRG